MELTQLDSESEHYYESESFESKSQSTPRSHTTSGRHLIQNLMDDEHEDGKKGRTRKRKDAKQSEKPQKRTEKDESNGHVDDALEQQHETKKKSDSETGKDALNDPHTQAVQNQPEKAPDSPREETESPIESEDRPHSSKHSERKTSEAPEEVAEEILQMNDTPSQQNTSRSPSASTIKSERETKKSDTPVGSRQSLRGESVNESNDIKEHIEEQ
uniref:Protein starmaker-like n=1 Tax=Saccoglossus kowalevskii TaxID=10224 RepID=A0ABM0MVN7_SACKO|nr:PREDICTED: protein starmaker-like [Saccoglossus kowalevskii]